MAFGREEFERQLKELGIDPHPNQAADRVVFDYVIPGGKFAGQKVRIGLVVPAEFPRTPPGGPHVAPRLLPINSGAESHPHRTAESDFGPDFQYLSRPYRGWKGREGVVEYLVHIDHLFITT